MHVQVDHAIPEILEHDITAVLGHRRTHARFEEVLDLGNDLVVFVGRASEALASPAMTGSPDV